MKTQDEEQQNLGLDTTHYNLITLAHLRGYLLAISSASASICIKRLRRASTSTAQVASPVSIHLEIKRFLQWSTVVWSSLI